MHSHYWLSGQVGALARDRWGVPLVHSMHTMAKVKNDALAEGDTPEPLARIIGEEQVVEAADMLIANTDIEAKQLINLYDADPGRVEVVHPGVDLDVFRPRDAGRGARRARPAGRRRTCCCSPAGSSRSRRPTCCCARSPCCSSASPDLRSRLVVPIVGGPSGSGLEHPESLAELAAELGLDDVVRFVPPVAAGRAGRSGTPRPTLVAVPSYNESFGLVAVEAQASGTPVVAAAVGGLTTVVRDGRSGLLVDSHEPDDWADALRRVLVDDAGCATRLGARRASTQAAAVLLGRAPPSAPSSVYERARVAHARGRCLTLARA